MKSHPRFGVKTPFGVWLATKWSNCSRDVKHQVKNYFLGVFFPTYLPDLNYNEILSKSFYHWHENQKFQLCVVNSIDFQELLPALTS